MADDPPPLLAGRYALGGLLGVGGMAEVRRAHDRVLGRAVAVKLLAPERAEPGAVARFRSEGRRHAAVDHPSVLALLDAGTHRDDAGRRWEYLVLPVAAGGSLARLLARRGALPPAHALELLQQVAGGLAAAHRVGILHRDVKPGNVLLDAEGRALLTDFGISQDSTATDGGELLGTAAYLSPQRLRGAPATAADDVFAVGVLGHELLTGQRVPGPLPPAVPAGLRHVLDRALDDDPRRRPADAGELAAALAGLLAVEVPRDATRPLVVAQDRPRHRLAAAALTGCAVLGGGLAAAFPDLAALVTLGP